jgi:mRNA interferase RelE/StbE
MTWKIAYLPEARDDLKKLDGSILPGVLKGIEKVSRNPDADGYGKPLGNRGGSNLAGLFKIKFKDFGIRVVYKLVCSEEEMLVIVVSARADDYAYTLAAKRRTKHNM